MKESNASLKRGKRIRIFIGEAEEWQGKPLYRAILEQVQQQGASGATVLRGIEGFGPAHHLSTERLLDISDNLPMLIEIVEYEERVDALLPLLDHLVRRGIVTVTPVDIVFSGSKK